MATFYKSEVISQMRKQALVPVFYNPDKEVVLGIIGACVRGGLRMVEFTNRGEGAADLFGEVIAVCRKEYPTLMVGVGSVRDEISAGIYLGKGADFIVGPTFNPKVAEICNRLAVPYSGGCGSASEINDAEAAGCEIVKVFPGGQVGGPGFFKAVHGPAKMTSLMPTGGVDITAESLVGWLMTGGAAALGIGSKLVTKDLVKKKDFAAIEENVRGTLHRIQVIKRKMLAETGVVFMGAQHVGVPSSDMAASAKLLGEIAGFEVMKPPTSTTFVTGSDGAPMEIGPGEKVKAHGHLALEVTDIDKAVAACAAKGIKTDGEVRVSSDKTVKAAYLAEGAFGLDMRVHLYCLYSEEVDKALAN